MKTSKAIAALLAKAKEGDSYWVEGAKLEFSIALERSRQRAGVSYKALAENLGTSPAYISKVFRGDANLTIESMVKLARAAGGQLQIAIVERKADASRWAGTCAVMQRDAANHPRVVTAPSHTNVIAFSPIDRQAA